MSRLLGTVAVVAMLAVGGCAGTPPISTQPSNGGLTPATICADTDAIEQAPTVASALAGLSPTSAEGVLWAYVKSACNGATPAAGVDASWTEELWATALPLLEAAAPAIISLL